MDEEQAQRTASRRISNALRRLHLLGCAVFTLWTLLGCASTAGSSASARRDIVESVSLTGIPNRTIKKQLLEGIGTQPSTAFLWRHTYESFDPLVLEKDLLRIERQLRRKGYYEAKVRAARVIRLPEKSKKRVVLSPVHVEIEVDPGPPILIGQLETRGLAALPFSVAQAAAEENRLREGQVFDEDEFEAAKTDIANSLADRGYAFAVVSGTARVDLALERAQVTMEANPGPLAKLGRISIEGLAKLDEKAVRRVLDLHDGDVYSRQKIRLARSALFSLGTFSKIEIVPDLSHPEGKTVPLTVRLEEASLHEVKLGGGGRLDILRLALVGHASWTHLNFLGGLRNLTITTRPGLTFYPTRFPTQFQGFQAPTAVFPENFFSVRLEQPGFLEARTKGFHDGGYNIYPLLYLNNTNTNPKEEPVVGYHELTTSVGLTRSFFDNALDTTLSVHWQGNFPFHYQIPESGLESNAPLVNVQVIYPELFARLRFLDDPIEPTQGLVVSNTLQAATGLFGTLGDIRIHPEVRTFVPLDDAHKIVLAARFGIGISFATNYGDAVRRGGRTVDYNDPDVIRDQQKMIFRAFYSGGPSSNRGYPYRRIGPQGPITFMLPNNVDCTMNPNNPYCLRPLGGFTLWEASTELRFHLLPHWSFVAFLDASDVGFSRFNFNQPHLSAGPGIRYHSPVGPIRLDWGIRLPGLQSFGTPPNEPRDVSETPPYNSKRAFDHFAVHILIGEDF